MAKPRILNGFDGPQGMETCRRRLVALVAMTIGAMQCVAAEASVQDPLQPAAAWLTAHPQTGLADANGAGASGLQIIVSGRSRKFAIIDGRVVVPGDAYNDTQVATIKPDAVVMKDPSKSVVVAPLVQKKVHSNSRGKPRAVENKGEVMGKGKGG
jgi:hypothetical protein